MKNLFLMALVIALLIALASQAGAEPTPSLDTFAHKATITTQNSGPFHRLVLPFAVYQHVRRPDLGDLRVFNERGEQLPHALLRAESQARSSQTETSVPFFPLPVAAGMKADSVDLSVTVRQTDDGTLVAVGRAPTANEADRILRGVVLDASKLDGAIRSLRLNVGPSKQPFHAYVIESSTDLQHWRRLKGDAQLVLLSHDGHQVINDRVEWARDADPYLRLLWSDPTQAPEILSVQLGVVETLPGQPVELWSGPLDPSDSQGNAHDYVLPGHLPLEKLRINLPETNTLTPLAVQRPTTVNVSRLQRHREEVHWQTLSRSVVYRLQSPQGEVRSPDIELSGRFEARLRLLIDERAGGIGSEPPSVQVGFVPHVLLFLARGEGPFVLAWGADSVSRGELPVATLIPGYEGLHKLMATEATLAIAPTDPAAIAGPAGKEDSTASLLSSKWILWAVILFGVAVLAAMARSLLKQLRQGENPGG